MPKDDAITTKVLLDHMQSMQQTLLDAIEKVRTELSARMDKLELRLEGIEGDMVFVKAGIQNIDQRLDTIEVKRLPELEARVK